MSFWDIFWPVFAAYVGGSVLLQIVSVVIGTWWANKQRKNYEKQMEAMLASGEIDPSMLSGMQGMEGGMPIMFDMPTNGHSGNQFPTTSGGEDRSHGQYL